MSHTQHPENLTLCDIHQVFHLHQVILALRSKHALPAYQRAQASESTGDIAHVGYISPL